jgi:hypothetical protein
VDAILRTVDLRSWIWTLPDAPFAGELQGKGIGTSRRFLTDAVEKGRSVSMLFAGPGLRC